MTTKIDTLVDRYLTDLEAELAGLPANRRREILDEVGEHIVAARAALDAESEAAIRNVLERLGDPADIAAEARDRFGVPAEPAKPTPWLEVIALVLLVIPFLGWVLGVVLVWLSRLWTTRDKLIGTLGGLSWLVAGLGTLSMSARGSTAVGSGPLGPTETSLLEVVVFVVPFLLPIAAAIYLGFRLRAHAGTVPGSQERSGHSGP
jgi:HAAS